MKIARIIDTQGNTRLGIPQNDGQDNDTVQILQGNILFGLEPTDEIAEVRHWLSPVEPADIYCIGLNYKGHAAEIDMKEPEYPVVFMKPSTALQHPGMPVYNPAACEHGPELDYEGELAVIIGRTCRNVPVDEALDYVLGYTCGNDISARKWQMHAGGGQWVRGKSFDTFCPLGPVLVTPEDLPDPQNLRIRTRVNGETLQDGRTGDMIFSVAEIIRFLSRDTSLRPGTAILTGTPAGVGFTRNPPVWLEDGDEIEVEIEGIGTLRNPVEKLAADERR